MKLEVMLLKIKYLDFSHMNIPYRISPQEVLHSWLISLSFKGGGEGRGGGLITFFPWNGGIIWEDRSLTEDLCYVDTALLKILTDAFMGKNIGLLSCNTLSETKTCKYSRLPIIRTFMGNRKKFELSEVWDIEGEIICKMIWGELKITLS